MLIKAKKIQGYKLNCQDGELGHVKEFYFDDKFWAVRYLVAETGNWLLGRQTLISPYALSSLDWEAIHINVDLTKKQLEDSPSLESAKPVSQQFEIDYNGYYGYPMYWGSAYMWGYYPVIPRDRKEWNKISEEEKTWDPDLRSTDEVNGYYIQASDGEIGHVEDFIIDTETWAIRYLVVNTKNWWPGKKVLVSPLWIDRVSWGESKVFLNLSLDDIKRSPEYNEDSLIDRPYEADLHRHYNRQDYWNDMTGAVKNPL